MIQCLCRVSRSQLLPSGLFTVHIAACLSWSTLATVIQSSNGGIQELCIIIEPSFQRFRWSVIISIIIYIIMDFDFMLTDSDISCRVSMRSGNAPSCREVVGRGQQPRQQATTNKNRAQLCTCFSFVSNFDARNIWFHKNWNNTCNLASDTSVLYAVETSLRTVQVRVPSTGCLVYLYSPCRPIHRIQKWLTKMIDLGLRFYRMEMLAGG